MSRWTPLRMRVPQWRGRGGALGVFALLVMTLAAAGVIVPGALAAADDDRFAAVFAADHGSTAQITMGATWTEDPATFVEAVQEATDVAVSHMRPVLRDAIEMSGWVLALDPVPVTGASLPSVEDSLQVRLGVAGGTAGTPPIEQGAAPAPWDGSGALPIAMDAQAARALAIPVGAELRAGELTLRVVGLAATPEGPGASTRAGFTGVEAETFRDGRRAFQAGAWADPGSIRALGPLLARSRLTAWLTVSRAGLDVRDRDDLAAAVRAATAAGASLPSGAPLEVSSPLPTALERTATAEATSRSLVWLLSLGWLASLGGAVVLAAGASARAAATSRTLLRARGAPERRVLGDAAVDAALLAVPAAILGAGAGIVVAPAGTGTAGLWAAVVAVGGALAGTAFALPALPARRAITLAAGVLVVLAGAAAFVSLAARGYARGRVLDPFLAAAPAALAVALGVALAAALPPALAAVARAAGRSPRPVGWLGARWAAWRGAGVAPVVALVLAVSSATTALCIGTGLTAGFDRAARAEVGADARVDPAADGSLTPPDQVTGLTAVAAAAAVDEGVGASVTDDARPRALRIFVADTAALSRVRPDIPRLGPGEALAPDGLAAALGGTVEVEGAGEVAMRWTSATLPRAQDRWLLLDRSTGLAQTRPAMTLVRLHGDAAEAGEALRAAVDAPVVTALDVREQLTGTPTVALLGGTLAVGVLLPGALAVLAVVAAVGASAREREDLWAMARLAGAAGRGRVVLAVWQVLPAAVAAAVGGVVVGIASAAAVQSATDLSAATGAAVIPAPAPVAAWTIAPIAVAVVAVTAVVVALVTRPRPLAELIRNGAS